MDRKKILIALAGNANVGKSVVFNHLTGLHQHIGNWPGKTVERAEGSLVYRDYMLDVIDLPGIYSLSTFSIEESVTREYLSAEKPDIVINVIDASVLERNLFLTLQLLDLNLPLIIALNQMDVAKKKGLSIDPARMEKMLGVPVVPMTAITGLGIDTLLQKAIEVYEGKEKPDPARIEYGKEFEEHVKALSEILVNDIKYPPRYTAIKLLEGDREIRAYVSGKKPEAIEKAMEYSRDLEVIHGHETRLLVAQERYNVARHITQECTREVRKPSITFTQRLDELTTGGPCGYLLMGAILFTVFMGIFGVGDFLSKIFEEVFNGARPLYETAFGSTGASLYIWELVFEGLFAGLVIAIPYIIPFYLVLGILEDSGYLTRIAFLVDPVMHRIGLHGKSFIPLFLGYGCTVPACLNCRIMETHRERFITAFLVTLIPCAARTVVIMGLVAAYVGAWWAFGLYALDLLIVFLLGRIAYKTFPGEPMGLIMEMSDYRLPHAGTVVQQTWARVREFIVIAFPLIIAGNLVLKILEYGNMLEPLNDLMEPVISGWLGLPAIAGITLVFGILRKELTLIMLATLAGSTDFALILTPAQMVVYALVTMLYIPCVATVAALAKEFGWKKALNVTVFEILFALLLGGLVYRLIEAAGIL